MKRLVSAFFTLFIVIGLFAQETPEMLLINPSTDTVRHEAIDSACVFAINEVDEFDGSRTIALKPFNIGYLVPSNYKTIDGYKMVEEAKMMMTFTENDTLSSFFITLAAIEREFQSTKTGHNVLLKLSNDQVLGLYTIGEKGQFDGSTNMRIYNHTSVLPYDAFYNLTHHLIDKIRINYQGHKRTITLTDAQKIALRAQIRCIGREVGIYPLKP